MAILSSTPWLASRMVTPTTPKVSTPQMSQQTIDWLNNLNPTLSASKVTPALPTSTSTPVVTAPKITTPAVTTPAASTGSQSILSWLGSLIKQATSFYGQQQATTPNPTSTVTPETWQPIRISGGLGGIRTGGASGTPTAAQPGATTTPTKTSNAGPASVPTISMEDLNNPNFTFPGGTFGGMTLAQAQAGADALAQKDIMNSPGRKAGIAATKAANTPAPAIPDWGKAFTAGTVTDKSTGQVINLLQDPATGTKYTYDGQVFDEAAPETPTTENPAATDATQGNKPNIVSDEATGTYWQQVTDDLGNTSWKQVDVPSSSQNQDANVWVPELGQFVTQAEADSFKANGGKTQGNSTKWETMDIGGKTYNVEVIRDASGNVVDYGQTIEVPQTYSLPEGTPSQQRAGDGYLYNFNAQTGDWDKTADYDQKSDANYQLQMQQLQAEEAYRQQQLALQQEELAQSKAKQEASNPTTAQSWMTAIWGVPEGTQLSKSSPLAPLSRQAYDGLSAEAKTAYAYMVANGTAQTPSWWNGSSSSSGSSSGASWLGRRAFRQR